MRAIPDMLIIEPKGFGDAQGFLFDSFNHHQFAEFLYNTTDYRAPKFGRGIAWEDHSIGISRPTQYQQPILSARDQQAKQLKKAEHFG